MDFTTFKSHLKYTSSQRKGIFALLSLIIIIQVLYFFSDFSMVQHHSKEEQQWLALQSEVDSLKTQHGKYVSKIYPFNPNFITDFKGYRLGMSVAEIDRLLAFRKLDKYVNSAREFQNVTKVSDSLLSTISPYFKFPDWVKNKKEFTHYNKEKFAKKEKPVIIDINKATKDELIKVYGIGEALSERILKEKEKLGGFASMEQLPIIWGLSPEVLEKLNEQFAVLNAPAVKKININKATIKELMQFPYFKYALAKSIVTYRSMHGNITGTEDLTKINGFPVEIVGIIGLYLEF